MMQVYCWYLDVCFCLTCIQAEKADKKQKVLTLGQDIQVILLPH